MTTFPMTVSIRIDDEIELSILADAHRQIGEWRSALRQREAVDFAITASLLNPTVESKPFIKTFDRPRTAAAPGWIDPPRIGYNPNGGSIGPNGNGDGVD